MAKATFVGVSKIVSDSNDTWVPLSFSHSDLPSGTSSTDLVLLWIICQVPSATIGEIQDMTTTPFDDKFPTSWTVGSEWTKIGLRNSPGRFYSNLGPWVSAGVQIACYWTKASQVSSNTVRPIGSTGSTMPKPVVTEGIHYSDGSVKKAKYKDSGGWYMLLESYTSSTIKQSKSSAWSPNSSYKYIGSLSLDSAASGTVVGLSATPGSGGLTVSNTNNYTERIREENYTTSKGFDFFAASSSKLSSSGTKGSSKILRNFNIPTFKETILNNGFAADTGICKGEDPYVWSLEVSSNTQTNLLKTNTSTGAISRLENIFASATTYQKMIVIGDSLSAWGSATAASPGDPPWPSPYPPSDRWHDQLVSRGVVKTRIDSAYPGYTTRDAVNNPIAPAQSADVTVVYLGANDQNENYVGGQNVSPTEYGNNLRTLLTRYPAPKKIVIFPWKWNASLKNPVLNDPVAGPALRLEYLNQAQAVASEFSATFIDLGLTFNAPRSIEPDSLPIYLADRLIHASAFGHTGIANIVQSALQNSSSGGDQSSGSELSTVNSYNYRYHRVIRAFGSIWVVNKSIDTTQSVPAKYNNLCIKRINESTNKVEATISLSSLFENAVSGISLSSALTGEIVATDSEIWIQSYGANTGTFAKNLPTIIRLNPTTNTVIGVLQIGTASIASGNTPITFRGQMAHCNGKVVMAMAQNYNSYWYSFDTTTLLPKIAYSSGASNWSISANQNDLWMAVGDGVQDDGLGNLSYGNGFAVQFKKKDDELFPVRSVSFPSDSAAGSKSWMDVQDQKVYCSSEKSILSCNNDVNFPIGYVYDPGIRTVRVTNMAKIGSYIWFIKTDGTSSNSLYFNKIFKFDTTDGSVQSIDININSNESILYLVESPSHLWVLTGITSSVTSSKVFAINKDTNQVASGSLNINSSYPGGFPLAAVFENGKLWVTTAANTYSNGVPVRILNVSLLGGNTIDVTEIVTLGAAINTDPDGYANGRSVVRMTSAKGYIWLGMSGSGYNSSGDVKPDIGPGWAGSTIGGNKIYKINPTTNELTSISLPINWPISDWYRWELMYWFEFDDNDEIWVQTTMGGATGVIARTYRHQRYNVSTCKFTGQYNAGTLALGAYTFGNGSMWSTTTSGAPGVWKIKPGTFDNNLYSSEKITARYFVPNNGIWSKPIFDDQAVYKNIWVGCSVDTSSTYNFLINKIDVTNPSDWKEEVNLRDPQGQPVSVGVENSSGSVINSPAYLSKILEVSSYGYNGGPSVQMFVELKSGIDGWFIGRVTY